MPFVPFQPHTAFVQPFLCDGFRKSGLYVQYDARLYPTMGRITAVHQTCTKVKPGDVVWFRPFAYADGTSADGETLYVIEEKNCEAVFEGFDEASLALESLA